MNPDPRSKKVTAVLGPTNTGKTHLAVERMLASPTGMIGLPLRLLAREIYDRAVKVVGAHAVALITGEEKIVPLSARYWVCTVEAMPSDIKVSFLAIDEIQLATDFERGHVFTDRILHWRGTDETMLLGAQTMRPLIEELIPKVRFDNHPRLSNLTFAGQKKISRLPRRSATVAFSAEAVYEIAELIRRQRGGAAVVLGALSPRTRNAQVALYQNGDVDHIVATDAIGMGLNMDIDHVAFAATRKFDGFQFRDLTAPELAQVAGRAGRYMNNGTFGVTGNARPFDAEMIDRLENHLFEPARVLQWRNQALSFSSLDALKSSLSATPRLHGLTRAQPAADVDALELLGRDDEIRKAVSDAALVKTLWDVCQIPDYRNITGAEHANLIRRVFNFITTTPGRIPEDWFARQLSHCAVTQGDIDTLSNRIAHVRTWTFIANRPDWIGDVVHWQERAREIEDNLSDALHERLTQRFVDRRTAVLMKRMHQKEEIMSLVEQDGAVLVEGERVGRIEGLRFLSDVGEASNGKTLRAAAMKAVSDELQARAQSLVAAPDPDFAIGPKASVVWHGAAVASLRAGASPLKPEINLITDEHLPDADRDAILQRVRKFLHRHISGVLEPLVELSESESITGVARGLAFRLVENFGIVPREDVAQDVKSLSQDDRAGLRKFGVRFGAFHIFTPALLKPAATELRLMLWVLQLPGNEAGLTADLPVVPGNGLTSAAFDRSTPRGFYRIVGFRICHDRVVRIDMLERLADMIRDRVFWRPRFDADVRPEGSIDGGGFTVIPDMMSLVGCSGPEFSQILISLGYLAEQRQMPTPNDPPQAEQTAAEDAPKDSVEPASDGEAVVPADPLAADDPSHGEAAATTDTVPEVAATGDGDAVAPEAVPEDTAAEQPQVLEVWWPKDTGPFRKPRRQAKPRPRKAPQRAATKSKRRPPEKKPAKPGRTNIQPEDSPFAVLSSLRAELTGKS